MHIYSSRRHLIPEVFIQTFQRIGNVMHDKYYRVKKGIQNYILRTTIYVIWYKRGRMDGKYFLDWENYLGKMILKSGSDRIYLDERTTLEFKSNLLAHDRIHQLAKYTYHTLCNYKNFSQTSRKIKSLSTNWCENQNCFCSSILSNISNHCKSVCGL